MLLHQGCRCSTIDVMNQNYSSPSPFKPEVPVSKKSEAWEFIKLVVTTIAIVAFIRIVVAQPFVVDGSSMDPTFANGQYLIVDQISYILSNPKRGDVAVLRFPGIDRKTFFIKRVIGLPGETINIDGNRVVTIYNDEHPAGFTLDEPYVTFHSNGIVNNYKIPKGEYYMMGDNRAESYDSRSWGTLEKRYLKGKAMLRLWPFSKIDYLPGDIDFEK